MSSLEVLYLNNFRNFSNQSINPSHKINFLFGDNAEGKSNFIESLYYLGHNKSFRASRTSDVIQFNKKEFQIAAKTINNTIKISKSNSNFKILIDEQKIKNSSELSQIIPIQLITPDKGFIVNGQPKQKRYYIDWGVFHVKREFSKTIIDYKKCLSNIYLLAKKNQKDQLEYWIEALSGYAYEVNKNRVKYLEEIRKEKDIIVRFFQDDLNDINLDLDFKYRNGWSFNQNISSREEIRDSYLSNIDYLLKNKQFQYGPSKATLDFNLGEKKETFLSRGEQKTLSIIFWLTQIVHLMKYNKKPVLLIDDLVSELDDKKIEILLNFLQKLDIQVFITNIKESEQFQGFENSKLFIIQKGEITEK